MIIKVLAFGIAKDIVGGSSAEITVEHPATAQTVRTALEEQYPGLKQLASFMIAVNDEYANGDEQIEVKDEIAIIPPVSGG